VSNNNGAPDPGLGEVVRITQGLIKLDTSNFGVGNARGEAEATDYTRTLLGEVGLECSVFESDRGRTNLVARWQGANPDAPALLLHGHLDVVPAEPEDWTFDPFGGELRDGEILGRGAVDMKGSNAMMIAAIRQLIRRGERPPRDIVIAMFADEESGGEFGSAWMVKEHPQVFAGVTDAVSEVGGYSIDIAGKRTYLLQTGEKGALWLTLTAEGRPGHGSQLHEDPAIVRLADAVAHIGSERWPIELGATTVDLFERVRDLAGLPADSDPESISQATGFGARFITSSIPTSPMSPRSAADTRRTWSRNEPPHFSTSGCCPDNEIACSPAFENSRGREWKSRWRWNPNPSSTHSAERSSTASPRFSADTTSKRNCFHTCCPRARIINRLHSSGSGGSASRL
jgi:acetylornithine deacetylase/succinyl-diaminopimelate desuccinylase-like protein